MGTPATKAKDKYNKKSYIQYTCKIKPELFNRLELAKNTSGLSRSQLLEKMVELWEQYRK